MEEICAKIDSSCFWGCSVCERSGFTQASNQSLKMPKIQLQSDYLVISYLHQCEVSLWAASVHVCVCLRAWACTDISHGLRKCRGVIEMALLEYVGRVIFLSLSHSHTHTHTLSISLSWTVYFCRYRIGLQFLFLDSVLESEGLLVSQTSPLPFPRFPLIIITPSVIGPLTGHTVAKGSVQTHTCIK